MTSDRNTTEANVSKAMPQRIPVGEGLWAFGARLINRYMAKFTRKSSYMT